MSQKLPQFLFGTIAACGSFCVGAVIGWSSPVQLDVLKGSLGYEVTATNYYWLSGLMALGGTCACIPTGFVMNAIGRKLAMIIFCIPTLLGWILLLAGNHVFYAYVGRFLMGFGGASFCITAPIYTTEIAEIQIRGMLGVLYQLLIVHGVLYAYIVGAFLDTFWTTILCGVLSLILIVFLFFIPETPIYYVTKNEPEKAMKSLKTLRGKKYDPTEELSKTIESNEKIKAQKKNMWKAFCMPVPQKALFIAVVLTMVQQLGGIKAVVFFITSIFKEAGFQIEPKYVTIIFGAVMCLATFASVFVVEKAGRRLLLIISGFGQAVSELAIGLYFFAKDRGTDVSHLAWIPFVAVLLYIIAYSLGFGPLPWSLLGELFTQDVKSFASSIVGTVNWFMAFIVALIFGYTVEYLGIGPTFWIFTVVNIIGAIFVIFMLPETKNKTIEEIQIKLAGKSKE